MICICLSCAIYQAYVSFSILLFLCYLLVQIINKNISVKEGWLQIGKQSLLYLVSIIAYYIIWKVLLFITNNAATSYLGIDSVEKISLSNLIHGVVASAVNLLRWFFGGNKLGQVVTLYSISHYVLLVAFIVVLIFALKKNNIFQCPGRLVLVFICTLSCVPFISLWNYVSPNLLYRPMMMHSVIVLFILTITLIDKWFTPKISTIFGFFVIVIIFNYSIIANIAYIEMDQTVQQSNATATRIMQIVNSYDNINQIAFVGSRQDSLYVGNKSYGVKGYPLATWIEEDLLYDHIHTYLYLTQYMDLDIPSVSNNELKIIQNNPNVAELPAWPNSNCSTVVDNILVIKLGN